MTPSAATAASCWHAGAEHGRAWLSQERWWTAYAAGAGAADIWVAARAAATRAAGGARPFWRSLPYFRSGGRRSTLRAHRSISPREKRRPLGGVGTAPARLRRRWSKRHGRRGNRTLLCFWVGGRHTAAMPRNSRIEHYTSSEGELTRQLQRMRALGIGGQFTALPLFSVWCGRERATRKSGRISSTMRSATMRARSSRRRTPLRPPLPELEAHMPGPRCATARTPDHQCSRR